MKSAPSGRTAKVNPSALDEVLAVFGRAEALYPELVEKRDYHAAELARLEAALAKLEHVIDGRSAPQASAPSRKRAEPAARSGGKTTVASLIISALSRANGPLSASELASAVLSERQVSKANLQNILRALREKGQVKATGKAKRFSYSLGNAPAAKSAPKAAPQQKKKGGPGRKKASAKGGSRSVREIILAAVSEPRSFAEILAAVAKERPDVQKNSVGPILAKLRKDAAVKASGTPRDYRYTRA